MAAIKKTKLYSSLWASCDELRGGMDASQYKDYILTLLFVKYVTDKFKGKEGDVEVPEGGSFDDIIAKKGDKNIGEEIDKIIAKLAEANELVGIIDNAKFNDTSKLGQGKEMVDKLTNIVGIFQGSGLDFKNNRADGDDLIGDAYEYLMRHFASESGKSKGAFYTPAEVSRVLAKIIGISGERKDKSLTVYDPACGSGSLLIKVADESPNTGKVAIYGQEKDISTVGLAKMNFVLHDFATAEIKGGNSTFAKPEYTETKDGKEQLKTFDYVIANPPFSLKNWKSGFSDKYGILTFNDEETNAVIEPPKKNGDYAWVLHILKSLKSTGKAAVILPHGVLFRGNAEAKIRKAIIDKGYIKGIIGLPANLFYGTGIPACILMIDKQDASTRKGIYMIDASKGFIKDGNKNRLREEDIYKIVTYFNEQLTDNPKYARFVPYSEIKNTKNNYNLNIPRYIDTSITEDIQDINGHLEGGIPCRDVDSLNKYWVLFSDLKAKLFKPLRTNFYELNGITKDEVRNVVYKDEQFSTYAEKIDTAFTEWSKFAKPKLEGITTKTVAKELIVELAEKLILLFEDITLIDKYDVYEVLLAYYQEVMADDIHLIIKETYAIGKEWENETKQEKKKDSEETKTKIVGWDGKLIPKGIIENEFFKTESNAVLEVQTLIEITESKLAEMLEENKGEDGVFIDFITDDKLDLKGVQKAVSEYEKAIKKGLETDWEVEEYTILAEYVKQDALLKEKNKLLKDMQKALEEKIKAKYATLTIDQIRDLLLHKKWFKAIYSGIEALYIAISKSIAERIAEIAKRYEYTLPQLEQSVEDYESKVKKHLKTMGYRL